MASGTVQSDKEQELIAVGASIAAGCVPCATFHFRAARITGASRDEIREAAGNAVRVRERATEIMARLDVDRPRGRVTIQASPSEEGTLLSELISVSAAFALNCTASLEAHVEAARRRGASDAQIFTALKIACAVKSMAARKVQAAAAQALGAEESAGEACDCAESAPVLGSADLAGAREAKENCGDDCSCHN